MPVPILIMGDAPDSGTGLGRISKDLAYILSGMPEFRVATFGRGGNGSRHLPWPQYVFPESEQWGEGLLIKACEDFSRDDNFIILTIWDASRLFWFGNPKSLPVGHPLTNFLTEGKFKRWGYFPIDATSVHGDLSILSRNALNSYDRILAYSRFGREVLKRSISWSDPDYIPHGIDQNTFFPRQREEGRAILGIDPKAKLVGCVMTNQARKDWGVWAETARILIDKDPSYVFWAHVDLLERYWSLPSLIEDFGLENNVKITQSVTDETLAQLYSACNATFLPSLGEGFGYPLAESMACGVPAIHVAYGAGPEIVGKENCTRPMTYRLDTLHNLQRPVLNPEEFARYIDCACNNPEEPQIIRGKIEHLFWSNLTPLWENWFRKGLQCI